MALDKKYLELNERVLYKNSDDLAVSIARCVERFEERLDVAESRLSTRLADIEDKIVSVEGNLLDELNPVRHN